MILLPFFKKNLNRYKLLSLLFSLIASQLFYVANTYAENAYPENTAPALQQATHDQAINIIEENKKLTVQTKNTGNVENDFIATEQSTTIEDTEEAVDEFDSVYKIELLIFAYVNTGDENSELWRSLERPDFSDMQNTTPVQKNKITFLNSGEKDLSEFKEIIRKMKINGHYRPLKHLVWQQKILAESAQDLFYVQGGNKYLNHTDALSLQMKKKGKPAAQVNNQSGDLKGESEMEGTIHIYRSRYLHIKPNLWLSEYSKNDADLCLESDSNQTIDAVITNKSITSYTPLTNFRLDQHRRIRSGELHYLDHPRFGLLIKFNRVEKPDVKNSVSHNPE